MPAADGGSRPGAAARRWPAAGPSRVPNWVYTDPDIFAREQERIFDGPNWLYVCLDAEIPNPGDFTRSRLGAREVVAVRGPDGAVNVLLNRCAHRSMQFCSANRGSAKEFICPYHQWTYDLEGKLLGVPFRRGLRGQGGMPEDFRPEEHGLQRLAVASRHGVVFASFAQPNETLEEYLGPRILGWFDRTFDGRELKVLGYQRQRLPGNWKLYLENNRDPYHASLLHVFLVTFGLFRLDQKSATEMDETGRHAALINQRGEQKANEATAQMRAFHEGLKLADPRLIDPVREYPGEATVVIQTLWPNLVVQQQSNGLAMRQVVPLDAQQFRPGLDPFRLCRRPAGDDRAPACARPICSAPPAMFRSMTARRCCCRRPASSPTTTPNAWSRWAGAIPPAPRIPSPRRRSAASTSTTAR